MYIRVYIFESFKNVHFFPHISLLFKVLHYSLNDLDMSNI